MASTALGAGTAGPVDGRVSAGGGAQGGDPQAARRGSHTGHTNGVGPSDSAGAQSGFATAVRSGVFRVELWLPSRTQRAPSRASGAKLRCGREAVGRRS